MMQRHPGLTDVSDEQQIRQLMDNWRRLTAEGDVDGLLSLLADDVIFLTPGNPPISRQPGPRLGGGSPYGSRR